MSDAIKYADRFLARGDIFMKKVFGIHFIRKMRDNGLNQYDVMNALTCKHDF